MGAIVYDEFQTTPENFATDLRDFIDTSTDWSVLSTWYETLPPISTAEAVGQTALSTSGTTASTGTVGETIVIDRGTAEEETLVVSQWATNQVTVTTPTAFAHDVGSTIERPHQHTVKATTPGGAQLVIDLQSKGIATNARQPVSVYRQFGASGVDELAGFIRWFNNITAGATVSNTPLHVLAAAGPDFLWISVEGPRSGEPYVESSGPHRATMFLGTIVPYDDADTSEPVLASVNVTDSASHGPKVYVSRNAADTASWVLAMLASLSPPGYYITSSATAALLVVNASRAGTRHFWPWVVCEVDDGPRGRLERLFYAGPEGLQDVSGQKWTLDGLTFLSTPAADVPTNGIYSPFGVVLDAGSPRPLVLVPISGTPA